MPNGCWHLIRIDTTVSFAHLFLYNTLCSLPEFSSNELDAINARFEEKVGGRMSTTCQSWVHLQQPLRWRNIRSTFLSESVESKWPGWSPWLCLLYLYGSAGRGPLNLFNLSLLHSEIFTCFKKITSTRYQRKVS